MTLKEKILNTDIIFKEEVSEEKRIEVNNKINKINEIKSILEGKDIDLTLGKEDIDNICAWFNIDTSDQEGREFIKELIQKVQYDSGYDYPVVFNHNLFCVTQEKVEEYLKKELTEEVLRELIQLVALIKIEKNKSLKEIAQISGLQFDSVHDFKQFLKYEKEIEKKIKHTTNFGSLIDWLSPFENDFTFNEEGKKEMKT